MFHMDLGLSRVRAALAALGLAEPPCPGAHVVGTNGKGSTSTFLAEILKQSGLVTGLYTSPHFLSPRERVLVNGRQLPEEAWTQAAEVVLRVSADVSDRRRLTYFELITVMAAWLLREHGCQACVWEAGLGAAHDATNAMTHHVAAFTPIGLDHTSVLGPTLGDIARDKAGALRKGLEAVTAAQLPEARAILVQAARKAGAALYAVPGGDATARPVPLALPPGYLPPPIEALALPAPAMPGPHQRQNFQLAACAWQLLAHSQGLPGSALAVENAAREAFIPGRLQIVPPANGLPGFVLDGAHNQPGLECLKQALDALSIRPSAMVFACLADKDLPAMLPLASGLTGGPILVPGLDAPGRALAPEDLAARLGPRARPVADAAQALAQASAHGGVVLVCGSLYLLAEAYALHPGWLERP